MSRVWIHRVFLVVMLATGLLYLGYAVGHRVVNAPSTHSLPFFDGFESGDLRQLEAKGEVQVCCDDSILLVQSPVRSGRFAASFSLRREAPEVKGSKRAEIRLKAGAMGEEYWYALSIFVPERWKVGHLPVTVIQWHGVRDAWLLEGPRPPPLRIAIVGNEWIVGNNWDAKRVNPLGPFNSGPKDGRLLWSGPLDRGQWSDWVFRVKWSYRDDGVAEAWKDGKPP